MGKENQMKKDKIYNFIIWERPAYPGIIYLPAESCVLPVKKNFGRPWGITYCFFEKGMIKVVWWKKEMATNGKFMAKNFLKAKYFNSKLQYSKKLALDLDKILSQIKNTKLSGLTNDDFLNLFNKFNNIYLDWWGFVQVIEPLALGLELMFKQSKKVSQKEFNSLTAPWQKSYSTEAEEQLLKITKKLLKKKNVESELKKYGQKYFWLNNGFGQTKYLTAAHFKKQIVTLIKKDLNSTEVDKILKLNNKRLKQIEAEGKNLTKGLKLSKIQKRLVYLMQFFTNFQDERKALALKTNHYIALLLKELAVRSKLAYKDVVFVLPQEYSALLDGTFPRFKIKKRQKHFSLIFSEKGLTILEGVKSKLKESKLLGELNSQKIQELEGMRAMSGKIQGRVKIILNPEHAGQLKKGEILVTTMTSPDFIMAIKKAKAIVTDEGGITSHAAIISRELGIPCVIGTKIATRVLKNGDLVEVNANHGLVKKL